MSTRKPRAFQIGGDVDPFSHGGVFACLRGSRAREHLDIELIRVQVVAEHVGETSALEYEDPFWVSSAYIDYDDLVAFVNDDNIFEAQRRSYGGDLERPKVGRKNIKAMLQYYIHADNGEAAFEQDDPDSTALQDFSLRGFRGDSLTRDFRSARKEHTLAHFRARYHR
jgi:hypothetical protein